MSVVLSTVLAVAAAVVFAWSTVLQQATARAAALESARSGQLGNPSGNAPVRVILRLRRLGTGDPGPLGSWVRGHTRTLLPVLGLLGKLVRQPAWLAGWLLNAIGFALHVVALHLGAIGVVQGVLVAQLPFALLMRAAWRSLHPTVRDWVAIACVTAGLVLLVALRGDEPQRPASRTAVAAFLALSAVAVVALLAVAHRWRGRPQLRTAIVAAGAATCFVTTAVLVVVITGDIAHSGLSAMLDWPLACVVISSIAGTLLVQDAFASGSLPTALTTSTISDPVLAGVVGTVLFTAAPLARPALLAGLPVVATLIITGVILIARSPTLHAEAPPAAVCPVPAATVDEPGPAAAMAGPEVHTVGVGSRAGGA